MATIIPVINKTLQGANSIATATWTMGGADTGVPVALTDWYDRSIQISGTFGAATVTIQGSNDGTNWSTLRDPASVALTFTTADIKQLLELSIYLRVITTGGTGTTLSVVMAGRQINPLSWS